MSIPRTIVMVPAQCRRTGVSAWIVTNDRSASGSMVQAYNFVRCNAMSGTVLDWYRMPGPSTAFNAGPDLIRRTKRLLTNRGLSV